MTRRWEKYTREILESAVRQNHSLAGVLRTLGLKPAGGSHTHISRRIKTLGIDTSHFLGQGSNRGPDHRGPKPLTCEQVFVLRKSGYRQKARILRKALLESGRPYHCGRKGCPLSDEWLGEPLVLHVNHKNGDWLDDRAENLEFLCLNCHSQTPTYCRGMRPEQRTSQAAWAREYRKRRKCCRGPVAEQVYARGLGPRALTGVRVRIPPGPVD
jgi:hypothetical protein